MRRFFASRGRVALAVGVLLVGASALVYARDGDGAAAVTSIVPVKQGDFTVLVTTAGELRARKFVQITLPANTQQAEAYQLKIQTIVPEAPW